MDEPKSNSTTIVVLVISALFLALLGRGCTDLGSKNKAKLDKELLGELFRDTVDLTRAGNYSGQFTFKNGESVYERAEGIAFFFDTGHEYKTREEPNNVLQHVIGKLRIQDANEHVVIDVNVSKFGEDCVFVLPPEPMGAFSNFRFMPGFENMRFESQGRLKYELQISVGDSNLPAGHQFFLAQKRICGMEYLMAALPVLVSKILWGIAGLLMLIAVTMAIVKFVQQKAATKE